MQFSNMYALNMFLTVLCTSVYASSSSSGMPPSAAVPAPVPARPFHWYVEPWKGSPFVPVENDEYLDQKHRVGEPKPHPSSEDLEAAFHHIEKFSAERETRVRFSVSCNQNVFGETGLLSLPPCNLRGRPRLIEQIGSFFDPPHAYAMMGEAYWIDDVHHHSGRPVFRPIELLKGHVDFSEDQHADWDRDKHRWVKAYYFEVNETDVAKMPGRENKWTLLVNDDHDVIWDMAYDAESINLSFKLWQMNNHPSVPIQKQKRTVVYRGNDTPGPRDRDQYTRIRATLTEIAPRSRGRHQPYGSAKQEREAKAEQARKANFERWMKQRLEANLLSAGSRPQED